MVLVQGTADVDDRDLDANRERYGRESVVKLPATKELLPPESVRRWLSWYFTRIYVHVRPERIYVWRDRDAGSEPELYDTRMEEVRSGHVEEPEAPHAEPEGGGVAWDARLNQLGTKYETGVVSFVCPDGFPFATRVPIRADAASGSVRLLGDVVGAPLEPGLACVTVHEHNEDFTLAAQLPGPRRPGRGRGRLGAAGAQAGRRLRGARDPRRRCCGRTSARRSASGASPSASWPAGPGAADGRARAGPDRRGHGSHGRHRQAVHPRAGALQGRQGHPRHGAAAVRPRRARLEAHRVRPGRRARPRRRGGVRGRRRRGRAPRVHHLRRAGREPLDQPRGLAQRLRGDGGGRRQAPGLRLLGRGLRLP